MSLIRNKQQVKQAIDYTGLEKGAIHFSDVDAKIEIENRFSIAIEVKRPFNEIPDGQRLLLERDAEAWLKAGEYDIIMYKESRKGDLILPGQIKRLKRKAIVIKVEYQNGNDVDMIPLHKCLVTQTYRTISDESIQMKWFDETNPMDMKTYMNNLIRDWNMKRLLKSK